VLLASQPVYDSTGRIVGYMGQPVQVCTTAARLRRSTAARLCRSSAARQRAPKRQRAATQQQVQSKQDGKQQPQAKEDSKQQVQPKEQE
jgi:hypothetical protein